MKYYKLAEEKVIETKTEIPSYMWVRKGILPYEEVVVFEEVNEPKDKTESIETLSNKVINTITKYKVKPTLEELKKRKLNEIKMNYLEKTNNGFECSNGIKLDCRESDKVNWLTLKFNLSNNPCQTTLKDFNNIVHVDLEAHEIIVMLIELESYYKFLLTSKWAKIEDINACSSEEELNNISLG